MKGGGDVKLSWQRERKGMLRWIRFDSRLVVGSKMIFFNRDSNFSALGDAMPVFFFFDKRMRRTKEGVDCSGKEIEFCSWIWGCSSVGRVPA